MRRYTNDQLVEAIKNSKSWRDTAYKLGLNGDAGGNTKNIKENAQKLKINFDHFKGRCWNKGYKANNEIPIDNLLKKDVVFKSTSLKKKIIKKGLMEERCSKCGTGPIWYEKRLELALHHIDGDKKNNEIKNLMLLCPNCHSQTNTFCGRKEKQQKFCKKCNKKISRWSKLGFCNFCGQKERNKSSYYRKVNNRPDKEILEKQIKELGYIGTGCFYNVSDTTIRKWIK